MLKIRQLDPYVFVVTTFLQTQTFNFSPVLPIISLKLDELV